MHKYLLFTNVIDCHVVPLARVHPMLFKNGRPRPKKPRPPQQLGRRELALKLARQEKLIAAKLAAKGIEYEWPSFVRQFANLGVAIPDVAPPADAPEEEE